MECESERERERELVEYVRKASPPPFLLKTYMMVEDPASDGVISWNEGGTAFVVWQPAEFARDLLPTLFKHSNFSSFVRQLNTYGFHKVATNRWEFSNERFRKGEREQLCEIRRRKATSNKQQRNVQVQAAATSTDHSDNEELSTSSSEITNLADENKRLKRENDALSSELLLLKRKCQQLVDLVPVSGDTQKVSQDGGRALKLFGVRLEVGSERVVSQSCKII